MPITKLYGFIDDAGPESTEPPAIKVGRIRIGGAKGIEFRLADDPEDFSLRLAGGRAVLLQDAGLLGEAKLAISMTKLKKIAGLCEAWRARRVEWAAYEGRGEQIKWFGYSPLLRYRPGRWKPKQVDRDDPGLPAIRDAIGRYRVEEPSRAEKFAKSEVVRYLESGLHERVGVVVRAKKLCAVLTRGEILVSERWPARPEHFAAVARLLVRRTSSEWGGGSGLRHLKSGAVEINWPRAAVVQEASQARDGGRERLRGGGR